MKGPMVWLALFLAIFYAVGVAVLGYGVWAAWRSTRAARWPTAPGTLVALAVEADAAGEGDTYHVKVRYAYAVDGVAYEGDRLAFGYTSSNGRAAHDAVHAKLAAAKGVEVRYDPADPAVSCLSFGLHRSIRLALAFALTQLAFVAGFTWLLRLAYADDGVLLDNLTVH